MAGSASSQRLNVMKKLLYNFSKDPMTGFYRDGYCRVGPEDTGNHSVAATLTNSFLDFTASRRNNLRSIGLTANCKWCLCAGRWKEALDAASKNKDLPKDVVPKVHLHTTHEKALDSASLDDLKVYAVAPEAGAASGRKDSSESKHGGRVWGYWNENNDRVSEQGRYDESGPVIEVWFLHGDSTC